jgi:virginiamycin B lyase
MIALVQPKNRRDSVKNCSFSKIPHIFFSILFLGLLGCSGNAAGQSFQDFMIPTGDSGPGTITPGPDGALWFVENFANQIGRITTSGSFSEFRIPTTNSGVTGIATGPDGALWFTESIGQKIGRVTTTGAFTEFAVPTSGTALNGIVAGPDGALWFTDAGANKIGRITTAGAVTEFPIPTPQSGANGITVGPDGALWFTELTKIGRVTTTGSFSEIAVPTPSGQPAAIALGPDGTLWYAYGFANKVGHVTTSGAFAEYTISTEAQSAVGIATGPDGAIWFTEGNGNLIGRITTSGTLSEYTTPPSSLEPVSIAAGADGDMWFVAVAGNDFQSVVRVTTPAVSAAGLLAAVLPSSRSIETTATATAFATIINASSTDATGCGIVPVTPVPATFTYQTTNPQTNAITGSPNQPVSIAGGKPQSFVIAFAPNAAFSPTTVALGFDCSGFDAAPSNSGLNTLLLSASSSPDIVALTATIKNDSTLHVTGPQSPFAVATVNLGANASITATANTGTQSLPLTIGICQTNPTTGQCLGAIASSVTTTINANGTPTFGIFGTATNPIAFLPAQNRIFVQFIDSNGVIRGSTSVAVSTQ